MSSRLPERSWCSMSVLCYQRERERERERERDNTKLPVFWLFFANVDTSNTSSVLGQKKCCISGNPTDPDFFDQFFLGIWIIFISFMHILCISFNINKKVKVTTFSQKSQKSLNVSGNKTCIYLSKA